ncbi:MAG: outer membrane beta-barrel protein [Ferruginibacter sp.]
MKKQLLTGIFALLGLYGLAQNSGKISGSIKDGGQQAVIDAASVTLLKAKDSGLVKTSITDKDGNFSFENLVPGHYIVMATSAGHGKTYSRQLNISDTSSTAETGVLQLLRVNKDLQNVTVSSRKPLIERKIDRTVVNVENMITATGGNAMEVLEKSPGVTVDKDGNISLKGKQGVIIMIDGKPTYMAGNDLVNFLTNMPASNLEQLEIMTNPPAKYDAAGNSGIINIKTKKNKQKGFNGSVSTSFTQGEKNRSSNSLNLNYRNGKINVFGTVNANYRNQNQYLDIKRQYLNIDKTVNAIFEQNSVQKRSNQFYNLKTGADYYLNNKTTLGIVLTGYIAPRKVPGLNTSYLRNANGQLDSTVLSDTHEKSQWNHGGVNLNMRHKFDSTGRELTADMDYLKYDATANNSILTRSFLPNGSEISNYTITAKLPSDLEIFSAKTDYTQMLGKKIKMDAGLKTSIVQTHNKANYFNTTGNVTTVDQERTSNFNYRENLNAAYVNFSTEIKKWGLQGGFRAENTNYSGLQYGNTLQKDSAFKKSYTSAFPTIFVSYKHNDKNQFGFSYGRRISRPDYEDLNPFIEFIDIYTYEVGNPFLKPMFDNKFELSHTYNDFLTSTVNYAATKNLFGESFDKEGDAIVVRRSNFGKLQQASLSVSAQVPVQKYWQAQIYTEGNYRHLQAQLRGKPIDVSLTTFSANISNQFTLGKGWTAELSGFYASGEAENQIIIDPLMQLNAGVQKQILKKKGTLKIAFNDFTGPMKVTGHLEDLSLAKASFAQRRDSRTVTLSFNYRFGKPMKTEKRRSGGAGDEQNRVGGGN